MRCGLKQTSIYTTSVLLGLALLLIATCAAQAAKTSGDSVVFTPKSVAFRNDMRQLWEDHVIWTRMVIVSVAGNQQDLTQASNRLMQNQIDIGNAIKPYYGDEAGDKLTALLKEHISLSGEILVAAKAGDNAKLDNAKKRWYTNADVIAEFLNKANPVYWPLDTVKSLMKTHLDTTLDEAVARLHGDWSADVIAFDKVQHHIVMMADALSLGIIHQFPAKFADGAAPADSDIVMSDFSYKPQEISVAAGTMLKWTNKGNHPHTVKADSKNAISGGPDSGFTGIQPGESFTWTVPASAKSGTKWYYHCVYHGKEGDGSSLGEGMSGSITVK